MINCFSIFAFKSNLRRYTLAVLDLSRDSTGSAYAPGGAVGGSESAAGTDGMDEAGSRQQCLSRAAPCTSFAEPRFLSYSYTAQDCVARNTYPQSPHWLALVYYVKWQREQLPCV
jgi:hypothetical protein